jgi:hypothetical protein
MKNLQKGKTLVLAAAGLSFLLSITLWFSNYRQEALFVGLWVPSILSLGTLVYAGRSRSRP